jgi:hypothetical protein
MKVRPFATQIRHSMIALALTSAASLPALAQNSASDQATLAPRAQSTALLQIVRDATKDFQTVQAAEAAGYKLQFGCVSGDSGGAMGLHYVNGEFLKQASIDAKHGIVDATHPPIVIFEPEPNGIPHLIGADYIIMAADWDKHNKAPPELMGQLFHLFDAPNRFELPAFYTLHVWAWKHNPNGAFVNWHPNVKCEPFNGSN